MNFADDAEEALRAAVWLANSAEHPDTLTDIKDEQAFLRDFPYTGRIDRDEAEVSSLRALRPRLRRMLLASRDDMVRHVNEALGSVPITPTLTRHDGTGWHLHAIDDERPLAERVLIETAMALVDVIRAGEDSRMTICEDENCAAIALDLSRNRSRRYCSTTCANRNAVAAYRSRHAER